MLQCLLLLQTYVSNCYRVQTTSLSNIALFRTAPSGRAKNALSAFPPLRFAPALRSASRWSAWLPSLLHLTLRQPHGQPLAALTFGCQSATEGQRLPLVGTSHAGSYPVGPRRPPHTAQTLRQPTASSAASPPGQATLPAFPNQPAGPALPLRSVAKAKLLRSSPRPLARTLTPAHRTSGPAARPPNHEPPHVRQRVRAHPNQRPRGQPSPPFPTLPPPRCATFARPFGCACAPLSLRLLGSSRCGHCIAVPPLYPPHKAACFAACPLATPSYGWGQPPKPPSVMPRLTPCHPHRAHPHQPPASPS